MAPSTITATTFALPGQTGFSRGSVRDIYTINNEYLVMVVTDRISAFDVLLPVAIPYKGQVLSSIASYFLVQTADIVPNWFIASPDPNVVIGHLCEPYKIEMVIRGYLVGHAWREYQAGKRTLCGVELPDGLRENDRFPEPVITPATHAEQGHDEDISGEEIVARGIIPADDYEQMAELTRRLYERGSQMAERNGLILVDTKYEFGRKDGRLCLIDEVHTPDSSRYFYSEGFEERQARGERQRQLSKEFVREWLIAKGFQGLEGETLPEFPKDFIRDVSERYIELFQKLTGHGFSRSDESEDPLRRINANITEALRSLDQGVPLA
ncbi:MAG: phosphoribosylaminoimidazolesuccinocarboxamide synthase [Acidimicrobiales bacterium]|jgi:phosphoribosylaminoimidazole-succinocarboxamide synthase